MLVQRVGCLGGELRSGGGSGDAPKQEHVWMRMRRTAALESTRRLYCAGTAKADEAASALLR